MPEVRKDEEEGKKVVWKNKKNGRKEKHATYRNSCWNDDNDVDKWTNLSDTAFSKLSFTELDFTR